MKKERRKGFTLIELLVVVAVIGLLAAVAIVALNNARARARDAKRLADIRQIQTALEMYFLDKNHYPNTSVPGGIGGKCLCSTDTGFDASCSGTVYMSKVPSNPSPRTDGSCTDTDYTYHVTATTYNTTYEIRYCLGSDTAGISAGWHWATPAGIANP